ncbi:hypothetical protein GOBAR_AA13301 [Gossypium barbadense]|uniref:Uncharacterized protein n=1 Tax=Gossypium barbadense TaxID=3634 RepID=A0A2P5XVH6_GOSBA|nr:hypothetical protein GOBAR_AA13301 [Gossypium barbadense]
MKELKPMPSRVQRRKETSSAPIIRNPNMQVYIKYLMQCIATLESIVSHYANMHSSDMSPWPQPALSWNAPTNVDPLRPWSSKLAIDQEGSANLLMIDVGDDNRLVSDAGTARIVEESLEEPTSLSREIDEYMDV